MGNQESSVLFSLNELMNMEQERIQKESDAKRAAEEAAMQARAAEEQRAREEEERRLREAAEQQRVNDARSREEAARLEAIRHGELEKARLDAENRARIEQLSRLQDHERQLHSLSQDKQKKKLLQIAIGLGVFFVIFAIGAGVVIKKNLDEKEAFQAQMQQLVADRADIESKMKNASAEDRKRYQDELDAKEKAIQNLQDHPTEAKAAAAKPVSRPSGPTGPKAPSKPKEQCQPGDPLCGGLN